jgi:hypothetical protein
MENRDALRAAMLARSTQTNEPGRCAALLPVLAGLPEPLALVDDAPQPCGGIDHLTAR